MMNNQNKDTGEGLSFEEALARLEQIVSVLESGNQPLAECLARYEEAVQLCRHCTTQLTTAEQRIQLLTTESGLQPAETLSWATSPSDGRD